MKSKCLLALCASAGLTVIAPIAVADDAKVDASSNANISAMIPVTSEGITYNADGSMSARVGLDNLKYLVATRNEDGELVYSHQRTDDVDLEVSTTVEQEEE